MDIELQTKALLVENIFEATLGDILEPNLIQQKIDRLIKNNPEIKVFTIALPKEEKFEIIAAKDKEILGQEIKETQHILAWHEDEAFAHLTVKDSERFWEVTKALHNSRGEKIGLMIMQLSLAEIDALTKKTITQAYLLLVVIIVVILLLVANHARLFQYTALYRQLQEVDKMKDEFIAMASHELRSPLTAIKGYIDLVLEELKDKIDKNSQEKLARVAISANRLDDLVSDLLDVSRIEQGRIKLSCQPLDLQKIIQEILKEFELQAQEKKLQLIYQAPSEKSPYVLADIDKLKQVLVNLISNAIKFTPQGQIVISTALKQNMVQIKVKDTGLGLSAEEQKKIFQKFSRLSKEQTAHIPGTGLGLWITKQLVEMMKGKISVESMEGVGSQFIVSLPLAK